MGLLDVTATTISGEEKQLCDYQGNVLLVVNTASRCGFTPQYEGLETLYMKYHDQGFEILGFPCNQFGGQEPGSSEEIRSFCKLSYGVSFPIFAKIDVNGPLTHPFFDALKSAATGVLGSKAIKWNFTKFLVSRDTKKIIRYAPTTPPHKLQQDIEQMVAENPPD